MLNPTTYSAQQPTTSPSTASEYIPLTPEPAGPPSAQRLQHNCCCRPLVVTLFLVSALTNAVALGIGTRRLDVNYLIPAFSGLVGTAVTAGVATAVAPDTHSLGEGMGDNQLMLGMGGVAAALTWAVTAIFSY